MLTPVVLLHSLAFAPLDALRNTASAGLIGFDDIVLCYFLLVCVVYFIKLTLASLEVLQHQRRRAYSGHAEIFTSPLTPGITIIAPAYNEATGIAQSVRALLNLRYPKYDVLIVNDGSRDETLDVLRREFDLLPIDAPYDPRIPTQPVRAIYSSPHHANLTVVDKDNGGKADALNCGINLTRTPLFCTVDADSVLDPNALLLAVKPFLDDPMKVMAVGGIVGVANGTDIAGGSVLSMRLSRKPIVMFQTLEYLRSYLTGYASGSRTNNLLIISGAFAVYRRDVILEIGGYKVNTIGEDAELTTRLHRHLRERRRPGYLVAIPDLVCYTDVPETIKVLANQRRRWHHGLVETLWSHRRLLFNPAYGSLGLTGYPYLFIIEMLAPLIEGTGYLMLLLSLVLGVFDAQMSLLLTAVAFTFGIFLSLGSVVLEEIGYRYYPRLRDILRMAAFVVIENLGYRQMTVVYRLLGVWDVLRGNHAWGTMQRTGLGTAAQQPRHTPV